MPENNEEVLEQEAETKAESGQTEEKKTKRKLHKEDAEKFQNELKDTKDQLLRTLAEYDNFRKRTQKERETLYLDSKTDVLSKILPVLDNFERASQNEAASYEDYRKGVDMIINQLFEILKGMNVESFGEKGDCFDPNLHSAVMHIESTDAGENEIVDVFVKGYRMGDRILRPASVRVAN